MQIIQDRVDELVIKFVNVERSMDSGDKENSIRELGKLLWLNLKILNIDDDDHLKYIHQRYEVLNVQSKATANVRPVVQQLSDE